MRRLIGLAALTLAAEAAVGQSFEVHDITVDAVNQPSLHDGVVVGGYYPDGPNAFSRAFAWTLDGGLHDLGAPNGDSSQAVATDGLTAAGISYASNTYYTWTKPLGDETDGGFTLVSNNAIAESMALGVVVGTGNLTTVHQAFSYAVGDSAATLLGTCGGNYTTGLFTDGLTVVGVRGSTEVCYSMPVGGGACTILGSLDQSGFIGGCSPNGFHGDIVVGRSTDSEDNYNDRAFAAQVHTPGLVNLGTLGGHYSEAYGVYGDIVVGYAETADHRTHAFAYDLGPDGGTMVDLTPGLQGYSEARFVNAFSIAGDYTAPDGGHHAALWTLPGYQLVDINPEGYDHSDPYGLDGLGNVLVSGGSAGVPYLTSLLVPSASQPEAVADSYAVHTGKTLLVDAPGVLENDVDPKGLPLHAALVVNPLHAASFQFFEDGSFTYESNLGFAGEDSFVYRASNGAETSNEVQVTIDVQDKAPTGAPQEISYQVHMNSKLTEAAPGVLYLASDPDGDPIYPSVTADPHHGELVVANDGSFTYTPEHDYVGADEFSFVVSDGILESGAYTWTLNVTDNGPVVNDDDLHVHAGQTLSVAAPGVLANDADPDQDHLVATLAIAPQNAKQFLLRPDGSFVYQGDDGYVGEDAFYYRVSDGALQSSSMGLVLIHIDDEAPVATADFYDIEQNGIASGNLLANDRDPDGDPLKVFDYGPSSQGYIEVFPDGKFNYQPESPDFYGVDSFSYSVTDGFRPSANGTVFISVHKAKSTSSWLDAAGGTVTNPDSGASIQVPQGDLSAPTAISVGPGTPVAAPAGMTLLGSAVEVGPGGTTFAQPATVTLLLPAGAGDSGLYVVQQEANGSQSVLSAVVSGSTVSVQVSGLSTFQVAKKTVVLPPPPPAKHGCGSAGAAPWALLGLLAVLKAKKAVRTSLRHIRR